MAINHKQLNNAQAIDISRADAKSDRTMAERMMDARLLAAASMQVEGERRWFALRTANRNEQPLCESLVASDVDAIVPLKKVPLKRRLPGACDKVVHRPVVSNLIFVRMVLSAEAIVGLLRIKGVSGIIGSQGKPYPIGDREMNGFMDLAQAGAFDQRNGVQGLKAGSKVRIKDGPFAEFEGVLQGYVRSRHVRVLAQLFGGKVTMELTLAQIEKLD